MKMNISFSFGIKMLFFISIICLFVFTLKIENYYLTYGIVSCFLVSNILLFKSINIKVFSSFFAIYYIISLPNISRYRGTITFETLCVFSLMIIIGLLPLFFTLSKKKQKHKKIKISVSSFFLQVVDFHLISVYLILTLVYLKYGFVVINQEARFSISPIISYFIKSTIYIPLFYVFLNNKNLFKTIKLLVFPLLPAILIGSRGTVILILISLSILLILHKIELGKEIDIKKSVGWDINKRKFKRIGVLAIFIIYFFYYSRRWFSSVLISNMAVIRKFFQSSNPLYLLILPLYASFRETVGLANVIIKNDYKNVFTDYPLFFAELATILPGKQLSPGQAIGMITGKNLAGGLTPNILGGLYIDFGIWSIFGVFFFVVFIKILYKKAVFNEYYKILYVITLTQFFHLFHRGFIKPEYIVSYLIIFFYFLVLNIKNENSSHSLSVDT